jgi:hypothetical protein
MADDRRPDDGDDRGAGWDVWLPAAAAIAAAFMIAAAHAETPPPVSEPRPIYEAWRFDEAAIAREAAEAAAIRAAAEADAARTNVTVRVVALPVLEPTPVADGPQSGVMAVATVSPPGDAAPPPGGWVRLLAPLAIAALLVGALIGIARVWHRTEPSLA